MVQVGGVYLVSYSFIRSTITVHTVQCTRTVRFKIQFFIDLFFTDTATNGGIQNTDKVPIEFWKLAK